jgi:hypothetical protein
LQAKQSSAAAMSHAQRRDCGFIAPRMPPCGVAAKRETLRAARRRD